MIVSVVIPTYNSGAFLTETLQSVQQQTLTDWELLIIDGGSTDDTLAIVQQFCGADTRIALHTQHGGVAFSRNRGAQLAKGEFIAFLDSDDRWHPDRLATHVADLKNYPKVGISYSRAEFINADGSPTGTISNNLLNNVSPHHFLYINPTITMSNIVVRKQVLETVLMDEAMSYSEDIDWIFRVMVVGGWQLKGIDRPLLQYRTNPGGLSSKLHHMEAGWNQFIENARTLVPDLVNQHYAAAKAAQLKYLARRALRLKGPPSVSADFMTRSLQADWTILLKDPIKSILLTIAIYGLSLITFGNPNRTKPRPT